MASLVATAFASLTAIFSVVNLQTDESTTLSSVALAIAILNALSAAGNSGINSYLSSAQRNVEDREPETSRASVAALKCVDRPPLSLKAQVLATRGGDVHPPLRAVVLVRDPRRRHPDTRRQAAGGRDDRGMKSTTHSF